MTRVIPRAKCVIKAHAGAEDHILVGYPLLRRSLEPGQWLTAREQSLAGDSGE